MTTTEVTTAPSDEQLDEATTLVIDLQREAARRSVAAQAAYAVYLKAPLDRSDYLFGQPTQTPREAERVARFQVSARNAAQSARGHAALRDAYAEGVR